MPLSISFKLGKYFKGFSSSAETIMLFVYMKCRFSLSYRELEEIATIRGVSIDHATLQRWVVKFTPLIDQQIRKRKKPVGNRWRVDETYIKVNGKWMYLYRAVDTENNTIDFLFRKYRDKASALAFFRKAIKHNGKPESINIDKSGSNMSAAKVINDNLPKERQFRLHMVKYLNNIVEQDHRFIKKRTAPMLGFKSYYSARNTLIGIENIRMIQKGQIVGTTKKNSSFESFKILMAA
jgi:putative transposase